MCAFCIVYTIQLAMVFGHLIVAQHAVTFEQNAGETGDCEIDRAPKSVQSCIYLELCIIRRPYDVSQFSREGYSKTARQYNYVM